MICICSGPTRLLDPARRVVTAPTGPDAPGLADNGMKPIWEDAGMVQDKLRAALGPDACEHSPNVQYRQDGVFDTPMRNETAEERYYMRMAQNGVEEKVARHIYPFQPTQDPFSDETLGILPAGPTVKRLQPPEVAVSDEVNAFCGGAVDLSWFPPNFAFGNGVTCNSWVPLTNPVTGERKTVLLSWCVLSSAQAARARVDAGVRQAVRAAMETI